MALLDSITCPADLRKLSMSELTELAAEMRDVIFNAVSQNGGHLAVGGKPARGIGGNEMGGGRGRLRNARGCCT